MSEDYHDKTEDPTPKRLAEARKKGYVAKSQDIIVSFHLLMCMIVFFFFVDRMFQEIAAININIFENLNFQYTDLHLMTSIVRNGLIQLFFILLPIIAGGFLITLIFNIIQTGAIFSFYPLMPKWSKLNMFNPNNYERILGFPAIIKLGFGIFRLQLVLILCVGVTGQNAFQVFSLGKVAIHEMVAFIKRESLLVGFSIALSYLAVAFCDFFYQKWTFNRKMRMSKREVKDEIKQMEGDQNIKIKMRTVMMEGVQKHALNDLSAADVYIVDGTQFVVAINYKLRSIPFCVDKGSSRKGQVMLEIAKAIAIPVIEKPGLAQKLYTDTQVKTYIKAEYYEDIIIAISEKDRL
jgi:flagellar biosynthesis protein FlhB